MTALAPLLATRPSVRRLYRTGSTVRLNVQFNKDRNRFEIYKTVENHDEDTYDMYLTPEAVIPLNEVAYMAGLPTGESKIVYTGTQWQLGGTLPKGMTRQVLFGD